VSAALSRQVRAAEYRRLALDASTLAQASALPRVREKHELAAERWGALAAVDELPVVAPVRAPAPRVRHIPEKLPDIAEDGRCIV
jgi:hypothetical protein